MGLECILERGEVQGCSLHNCDQSLSAATSGTGKFNFISFRKGFFLIQSASAPAPPPFVWNWVEVWASLHKVQRVVVLLQQAPVGPSVGHRELYLPCLLSLQQQPGGGVELDVGHVGRLCQLLGLGLDELLVTISEGEELSIKISFNY